MLSKRSKKLEANKFVLLSSPLMNEMGDEICAQLENRGVKLTHHKVEYTIFANGEILARIPETIRGQHVFFLDALQHPDPNTALLSMLITMNAIKYASASAITLVAPFLPYLRQDRKDQPRVPITARLLADLIEANKLVKSIITIDMHAEQIPGFFSIPVDNLVGVKVFIDHMREELRDELEIGNVVVLSPDFGGAKRNRKAASALGDIPVSIIEKRRVGPNKAEVVSIMGEPVTGKTVLSFEDIACTGTTAIGSQDKMMEMKAKAVYLCATHGIFSRKAEDRFRDTNIKVFTTDSIPRSPQYYEKNSSWLKKISIVPYFANAMYETMLVGGSISKLSI